MPTDRQAGLREKQAHNRAILNVVAAMFIGMALAEVLMSLFGG
jgi:hypothetical protein